MFEVVIDFVRSVTRLGSDPADTDELRLRKMVGVSSVALGGMPLICGYGLLFLALGEPRAGVVMVAAALLMALGLVRFRRSRDFAFYNVYWLAITHAAVLLGSLSLGGFLRDGMFTLWGIVVPVIATVTNKPRHALAWIALFALEIVATLLAEPLLRHDNNLSAGTVAALSGVNVLCFAGFLMCVVLFFVQQQDALVRLVRTEQQRSDALLLNILPPEIAAKLRGGQQLIADRFADVSVLFADIVGFTPLAASMPPLELVELLNEVFSFFDSLVEEYGLEKIKTIGDCYMVAAGAPRPRSDHAQVLVRMALRVQAEMRTRTFGRGLHLEFRIGIHSGPVVAGVIGHKKFIYDLWGDAVNTASRMESHGHAGAVQITEATWRLIADAFECEPRGSIDIKGKGAMRVWLVTAARAPGA